MDTVQMNKKIKEIMDSSDVYLLSEDAAKAIGVAPQNLREQAKDEPEKLGFNVIVVGTSIRIPRIPFLNYILGSNPLKGALTNVAFKKLPDTQKTAQRCGKPQSREQTSQH